MLVGFLLRREEEGILLTMKQQAEDICYYSCDGWENARFLSRYAVSKERVF